MNPSGAALPPREVAARLAGGLTADALLAELLGWAASFARVPVSGFAVGAVARGVSGAVYAGANLELAGLPLGASVHAEQAAVTNAWLHGEAGLEAMAVSASPCGHCRQFLCELADAAELRILVAGRAPARLGELLPGAFGPADLGVAGRLLDRAEHALQLEAGAPGDELTAAAAAAAAKAYAPYTGSFAGAALRTADGTSVAGRYAESAAYNPSLPALQAALIALALRRSEAPVAEAVLVEAAGPTSQRSAAEAVLGLAAPGVALRYVRARPAAPSGATMGPGG